MQSKALIWLIPIFSYAQIPSLTPIHNAIFNAKKAGLTSIKVPASFINSPAFHDVDTALQGSYIVSATLIDKETVFSATPVEKISTYFRFRINEELRKSPIPPGKMPSHVPERFRGSGPGELIVLVYDRGQIAVDGVLVTEGESLSEFVIGKRYLLLADFNGTRMASFALELQSVWRINGQRLAPLRPESEPAKGFRWKGIQDITSLKSYLATH